jgi:GPH family glycoside/pentoside/hexuronide:cation symporter
LLGLGAGGLLLVGQSMLPDTMQYDYQKTGIRREGIFAGVYTTVEKISFAIGPALLGLIIGYAGYDASAETLSDNVRWVIYLCAGGLPVASLIISCLLMILYNLNVQTFKEE